VELMALLFINGVVQALGIQFLLIVLIIISKTLILHPKEFVLRVFFGLPVRLPALMNALLLILLDMFVRGIGELVKLAEIMMLTLV